MRPAVLARRSTFAGQRRLVSQAGSLCLGSRGTIWVVSATSFQDRWCGAFTCHDRTLPRCPDEEGVGLPAGGPRLTARGEEPVAIEKVFRIDRFHRRGSVDEQLADLEALVPDNRSFGDVRVVAATAHAVTVDGQYEVLIAIDRPTLPRQAQDALADRLRNIDGIPDPSNGVIVVVPHRLALIVAALASRSRIDGGPVLDLLEVFRGVLQVVLELRTGKQDAGQSVIKDVQPGDVFDLNVAFREGRSARER